MLLAYALTFICSVFPCTQVFDPHGQITTVHLGGGPLTDSTTDQILETGKSFVNPLTTSHNNNSLKGNISTSESNLKGVAPTDNHLLIPAQDQPKPDAVTNIPDDTKAQSSLHNTNNNLNTDDLNPIVQIKDGGLRGFIMHSISGRTFAGFQSIPFAQPPVGPLRFKAPEANPRWKGIRDAIAESPTCIQADYIQQYKIHGQEDCLYLNVYTPQIPKGRQDRKTEPLPVMVFIHGGGWFFSTSNLYGPAYLLDQDVVLVSMNYRLSMFGFLSTGDEVSPGNNGLKDQALALKWVQENIAAFGGDPTKVTIFGESAGAGSVHFHMVSPLSKGLFHRAISQSGCATCFWSISERAAETTRKYSSLLNCTGDSQEIVNCLRDKDATQLVQTQLYFLEWIMYPVVIFGPVLEPSHPGAFLDESPEEIYKKNEAAKVPWITGFNADEGAINIAMLFLDNKTISQLNSEWDSIGPIFLDVKNSGNMSVEVANKVRQFYIGDENMNFDNRHSIVKMFSDRYVIACGVKAIRLHAEYNEAPVYAYRLGFKGKYSTVNLLGQNAKDWGVSHMDDLIYLFNNTAYYTTLDLKDEEYKMSKVVTSLWTNFAATGKPLLTNSESMLEDVWTPVEKQGSLNSSVKYLELDINPTMINDPFEERVKFWRHLSLTD